MLSTPFDNLKHFLTSRPPLTIFVVCLATITLAGFGFAYYIDVADRVINGDEQQNWVYFLKYMNRKEYCLEKGETFAKAEEKVLNDDNRVYIPGRISFPDGRPDFNSAKGVILIDDWQSSCRRTQSNSVTASLTFAGENFTTQNVCIALYIPYDFLSPFTEATCRGNDSVTVNLLKAKTTEGDSDGVFCEKGTKVKLNFDEASPKNFKVYLTQAEVITIYVHLMWFNSIVLFVVIVVLCYAVFLRKYNKDEII